jgi:DNA (cytosine-5)-methyltransferase 1
VLNGLGLFEGIGGITEALAPWVQPVAYCERDRDAQSTLLCRVADGSLPVAPIWDDVRTLGARELPPIDMVYGGFPCQDISAGGLGEGLDGERSGLFWQMLRIIRECRPTFVFIENVSRIAINGGCAVVRAITESGYDCRWDFLSAAEVGSKYLLRERFWLLGASQHESEARRERFRTGQVREKPSPTSGERPAAGPPERFIQPRVDRTGDGIPRRLDRHRGLGNAVVPLCAREAFKRLSGLRE